jgi:aldehyde dehydrogenase (NAD+)
MSITNYSLPSGSLLIGENRIKDSSGGIYEHIYAADGKVNAVIAMAGAREVDQAVASAWEAQKVWMAYTVDQRRDMLIKLADLCELHFDELNYINTQDYAVPISSGGGHPAQLIRFLRYYAGWVDKSFGETTPTSQRMNDINMIDYEPYGVVAVILNWNGPLFVIGMNVAPALAAGNAVVIKPPELSPLGPIRFGELCLEAGLPPGLVNIIPGGPETGDLLVRHPGVRKIHFTGGGHTAKLITKSAADNLTPLATELGGKAPALIYPDADISQAAFLMAMTGPIGQSGQSCACASRVLVHDKVYDEFMAKYIEIIESVKIGDPLAADTVMGPVVSKGAHDRILGVIDKAVNQKMGELVTGGGSISAKLGGAMAGGYFIAPTVFAGVSNNSELARMETFGPVASVMRWNDESAALAIANDTEFGLNAYVFTQNLNTALRMTKLLEAGSVWVNGGPNITPQSPYGGYKQSGSGSAGGIAGLREFQQVKTKRFWME